MRQCDGTGLTHLELPGGTELVHVILGDLCDFQQSDVAIVVDDGSAFDIRLGLVCDFHDVLCLSVDHSLEDVEVDDSSEIVDVGDEDVFLSSSDELVEQARVSVQLFSVKVALGVLRDMRSRQGVKDITVAWRVPIGLVARRFRGTWK